MKSLLVVWHSLTGGTRQMAEAAAAGARTEPEIMLDVRHAADADASHLLAADGFLFAAPETLATLSGIMKDFFDRSYYAALDRIGGRPYAAMVCAGSDGSGAARQIERIAAGWRIKPVAPPLIVRTLAQTPEAIAATKRIAETDLARCHELGAALAAGVVAGIF